MKIYLYPKISWGKYMCPVYAKPHCPNLFNLNSQWSEVGSIERDRIVLQDTFGGVKPSTSLSFPISFRTLFSFNQIHQVLYKLKKTQKRLYHKSLYNLCRKLYIFFCIKFCIYIKLCIYRTFTGIPA